MPGESTSTVTSIRPASSRAARRSRRKNRYHKKNKETHKSSLLNGEIVTPEDVKIVNEFAKKANVVSEAPEEVNVVIKVPEEATEVLPPQIKIVEALLSPTKILQSPKRPSGPTPAKVNHEDQKKVVKLLFLPDQHRILLGMEQGHNIPKKQPFKRHSHQKAIPEELKVPSEVYKAMKKYDIHYQRYRDLITSGKISEARRVRGKILEVWEKEDRMKLKRDEATVCGIDVVAMFCDM